MRVIGDEAVSPGFRHDGAEAGGGLDVGVEPEFIGPVRRDVDRAAAKPVETGSSPGSGEMWFSVVLHRNQYGQRTESVAGGHVHGNRRVTEGQFLTVGGNHVTTRLQPASLCTLEQGPILGAHNDARAEVLLQVSSAANVVPMRVAHDDVLD